MHPETLERPHEESAPFLQSEDCENEVKYSFQRVLKFRHGFAFTTGMLLGSGLFVSPGLVAAASPNMFVAFLAWTLSGLFSIVGASCYCKLASLFNRTGGTYLYVCRAYHPIFGFILAWISILIIEPTVTAVIALSSGAYITKIFVNAESDILFLWTVKAVAVGLLLVLTAVNCLGVKEFGIMQVCFTLSQVSIVIFVVGLGIWHIVTVRNLENFTANVFFNNSNEFLTIKGIQCFGDAMYASLWAFDGWSSVPFLMEELENPSRNVPMVTLDRKSVV